VPCEVDNKAFAEFLSDRGGADLPSAILTEAVVRTKLGADRAAINPADRAERFIRTHNAGFVAGDAFASGFLERKRDLASDLLLARR
jgi:hypothetical protein